MLLDAFIPWVKRRVSCFLQKLHIVTVLILLEMFEFSKCVAPTHGKFWRNSTFNWRLNGVFCNYTCFSGSKCQSPDLRTSVVLDVFRPACEIAHITLFNSRLIVAVFCTYNCIWELFESNRVILNVQPIRQINCHCLCSSHSHENIFILSHFGGLRTRIFLVFCVLNITFGHCRACFWKKFLS